MAQVEHLAVSCPVCGSGNDCALAAGEPAAACWCRSVKFHAAALATVPVNAIGARCLCRRCARRPGPGDKHRDR